MKEKVHVIAAAALVAAAVVSIVPAAGAQQVPLQRQVDALTGAEVRLYHGERPGKEVRVEIQDPSVLIRKEIVNGTSVTTIASGTERISLALSRHGFVVTSGDQRVDADREHPDRVEAARQIVARSNAVKRATTLLGKLAAGPVSALRHTARITRATLLSAAGDSTGKRELSTWARAARDEIKVKPVSDEQGGPGQCWYLYALEAIAAYIEYEDCMNQLYWYEILDMIGCALIYDLRAIGAFSWWITCVGFRA
ncbi:MAG TPA: hypothetical protein VES67_14480 [Vicinamibacterales bacterium]|nr:hypothetical protein [Vicinamibacterales bacterium]